MFSAPVVQNEDNMRLKGSEIGSARSETAKISRTREDRAHCSALQSAASGACAGCAVDMLSMLIVVLLTLRVRSRSGFLLF